LPVCGVYNSLTHYPMNSRTFFLLLFALFFLSTASFAQRGKTFTGPSTAPLNLAMPVMPLDKAVGKTDWSFLPLSATHADQFVEDHPTYDGRGVIIFIFDTGVDPGIAGLQTTTEDKRKIIDVRDVSGTGDVAYALAERVGDELRVGGKTVLRGMNSIDAKPIDGHYYYGALNELRFQNGLGDLNFNSIDTDVFGVLVFMDSTNHYAAYVDSDGDHDLTNEHKITNYREHYDTFAFHSNDSSVSSGKRLTGAVTIYPDRQIVSLYFDDGSHGTHVAGIASGHNIDNQTGFNGVAPGAQVIAVKFADNNAGGVTVSGSMQKAFEFAAETAKSQSKPVVVNMSFGIGNELEGQAAMDKWLDSLLAATPNLTVCVSAGNEGPGLSSIGLPGSANRVIASGAALPADAAQDLYDLYLTHPVLFDFSSRGGELAKPDIVSPGTAVSTVPDYITGDRYNGTSMSSPYTTGCCALLLSAMKQAFPDWTVNAYAIKRAMMLSATHIENATPLDEGYGMIDVPAAFELLSRWHRMGYVPIPVSIQANIPSQIKTGTAAYFRAGNYPKDGDRESFTVEPDVQPGASARERAIGMEAFDLVSDEAWMSPLQSSIYRRGGGPMSVDVRYNAKLLQKPGLYSGRIWGYEKGSQHTRGDARFELVNSIIIPNTFSDRNDYRVALTDMKIAPDSLQREFFAIPPGAKEVKITLASRDPKGDCSVSLFDNAGQEISKLGIRSGAKRTTTLYFSGAQLTPGIWEADLSRIMSSEDERDLAVDFTVEVQPLDIENISTGIDNNSHATLEATIANSTPLNYRAEPQANITGYERTIDTLITESDQFTLSFSGKPGERGVVFDISLPAEDYDLFTDIACQVLHSDSSASFNSAFDYRTKTVPILFGSQGIEDSSGTNDNGNSLLFIRGGLALPDHPHPWHLHIVERRYLQHGTYLAPTPTELSLPSYQSQELEFISNSSAPSVPSGYRLFGSMDLKKTDQDIIRIPVEW
jgi:tripeptidyl-peptidase II